MRITVDREIFTQAIMWAARTVPSHPAVPVLAGVYLEASQETLTFSSFDYEVSGVCTVPANVDEPGKVLVSGRLLSDIAKNLPKNKPVSITVEDKRVNLDAGSAHFVLSAMADDDYPRLPAMPPVAGTIDAGIFAEAVSQVTVAASNDDSLPLLTAMLLEIDGTKLSLLATDRYRLAARELQWKPNDESMTATVLIKNRTIADVAKQLTNTGDITIALSDPDSMTGTLIGFEGRSGDSQRSTTSLLTDGSYPPVRRLFPDSCTIFADVATAELIDAVKRASLVADRLMPVLLTFSEGTLTIKGGMSETTAQEDMPAHLEGEEITVGFNPQYLIDGVKSLGTPYARFSFTHPSKPAMITGVDTIGGDEKRDFRYLLMPHRYGA